MESKSLESREGRETQENKYFIRIIADNVYIYKCIYIIKLLFLIFVTIH
jgi:hypothetical protein